MARVKKTANGGIAGERESSAPSSSTPPTGLLNVSIPLEERELVKINNASPTDLKNACDDALKRFLSRPDNFNQIYTHTDVRLGLGWASVLTAAGTAFYGYKVEFEKSKPVVWAGLILYILLTVVQTLYAFFIEKDTVFVGKRKTFDKRIVTERITISSRTIPSQATKPPSYALTVSYVRSAGKSLLGRGKAEAEAGYNAFFDEAGTMDQVLFEAWVANLVERVMAEKAQ